MNHFSRASLAQLRTCHPWLQLWAYRVLERIDIRVLWGWRSQEVQDRFFREKLSKVQWPNSKHNFMADGRPVSLAIDIAPVPIDWDDTDRFYMLGGIGLEVARDLGIPLRWGGDWDRDTEVKDQEFMDLVHFELVPAEMPRIVAGGER